jgi:hypothetical protein
MQMELPGLDPGPIKRTQPGEGETRPGKRHTPGPDGQLVLPGTVLRLAPQVTAQEDRLPRKRVA